MMLSQYSSNPGRQHWIAINQLLCYLSSMKDFKLIYNGNFKTNDHFGYSDSNWAGDLRDYWSVSGFTFIRASTAVSWSSKKQLSITLSSTEWQSFMLLKKPFGYSSFYKTSISLCPILQLFSLITRAQLLLPPIQPFMQTQPSHHCSMDTQISQVCAIHICLITCMVMSHVVDIILNLINYSDNVGATLHSNDWHTVAVTQLLLKSRIDSQKGNHTAPFPCFSQCFPKVSIRPIPMWSFTQPNP